MKKIQFWSLLLGLTFGSLAFTACSSDSSDDNGSTGGEGNNTENVVYPDPANMKYAALSGVVTDGYNVIVGAKVTSGDQVVTTSLNGSFTFDKVNVVGGRVIVKFEKKGYMSVTRSFPAESENHVKVAMKHIDGTTTINTTHTTSATLSMASYSEGVTKYMQVELPTKYKNGNTNYEGQVKAEAVYLDPENENFANQMPGDLTTNNDEQLVSLGMVAVELTGSNGEQLQLADGEKAKLTFPVPANAKEVPATMPLWSFNETTGLWEKEGEATYDATKNAYVGYVTHFSWHNLDYEMARATLKVKVTDANGNPVVDVPVDFDGQREINTDKNGIAKCVVPSDTKLYVRVKSEDYGNYAADYSNGWPNIDRTKEAKLSNITIGGGKEKTVELKLGSRSPIISGGVVNQGGGSKVCTVYMTFATMQQTSPVVSDLNGAYKLFAPANYTGKAKVIALFGDGSMAEQEFEMDGTDKTVNILVNNNSTAGAGIIQVTGNGFKFNYNLTDPIKGDASLKDGALNISLDDMTQDPNSSDFDHMTMYFHYFNMSIANYTEGKSEYEATFNFGTNGHGGGRIELSSNDKIKLQISKDGSKWNFKVQNAKGDLYDQNRNIEGQDITFSGEFSATVTNN